uniref:tRNA pseudouridine(55) synthase n=1 Tax=Gallus gallus TaxID=9031 RepID=A0A8V0ZQL4_CHICK
MAKLNMCFHKKYWHWWGSTVLDGGHGFLLQEDQVTKSDLENVLQKFTGDIMQVPPLYSALKRDGERLSTLMKRGEAVEAKPARPMSNVAAAFMSGVWSVTLAKNFQPVPAYKN